MSTELNPGDLALLFRAAYAQANAVTVFWCPTIFRDDDSSDGEHSLSRFLAGDVLVDLETNKLLLLAAAKREINVYFGSFSTLKGQDKHFLHLLEDTLRKAAETGAERYQGLKRGTVFVDLAPSDMYKEIVQRLGKPAKCRPSLGFYIEIPRAGAGTGDIIDDLAAAGDELSKLQMNLEFQIEATYEPPPSIDDFLQVCYDFLRECKQYSLFVDLGPGNSWKIRSSDAQVPFEQTKWQRMWYLKPARASDVHSLHRFVSDRVNNHLSRQPYDEGRVFSDYVVPRWVQQAKKRGQQSFGATLTFAERDGDPITVRIDGFSHWLFEALFPLIVSHPRSSGAVLKDEPRPPDPILLSADNGVARFAIYEIEPAVHRCLCGNEYPAHKGKPTIVPLREPARTWIERQYRSMRDPVGLDWRTLSAPRTYLVEIPEIWSKEEDDPEREAAVETAISFWQNLLTTFFEAHPL